MAIKNSVSNDFEWSTFVDSINVFDCHLPGVRYLSSNLQSGNNLWKKWEF